MKKYIFTLLLAFLLLPLVAHGQWDRARRGNPSIASHDSLHLISLDVDSIYSATGTIVVKSDLKTLASLTVNLNTGEVVTIDGAGGSTVPFTVDGNKTSGNIAVITNENAGTVGDSTFVVSTKGWIGIGSAASATYPLSITGGSYQVYMYGLNGSGFHATNGSSGTTASDGAKFGFDNTLQTYLWSYENAPILFATNNTQRMEVNESGNIGIATTTPGALLTVNSKSDTLTQFYGDKDGTLWSSADSAGLMVLPTGAVEIGNDVLNSATPLTLKGNNGNSAKVLLAITNTDEQASAETNQTSEIYFYAQGTSDNGLSYSDAALARIKAGKASDFFNASGTADNDGYLTIQVPNAGVLRNVFTANYYYTALEQGSDVIYWDGTALYTTDNGYSLGKLANRFQNAYFSVGSHTITHSADAVGAYNTFAKSRHATAGSHTIVQDNDVIGGVKFTPSDGTDFGTVAAQIHGEVDDASPAASSIGGALVFSTAPGLASDDLTERMRIGANGNLNLSSGIENAPVAITDATPYTVLVANSGKVHIIGDLSQNTAIDLPAEANGLNYEFWYGGAAAEVHDHTIDSENDNNYFIGNLSFHDTDDGSVAAVFSNNTTNSILTLTNISGGTNIKIVSNGTVWYITGTVISDTAPAFSDQP